MMLQTAATSFKREKPLGEQAAQLRHYSYLTERWGGGGGVERERRMCERGEGGGEREVERNRRLWGERGQKEMGGGGGGGDERERRERG